MNNYYTEGVIRNVTIEGNNVSFTLEPTSPYVFEKKNDDGSTERYLLFIEEVDYSSKNNAPLPAKIIDAKCKFKALNSSCFHPLIIAKANRMRMKIKVPDIKPDLTEVTSIEI